MFVFRQSGSIKLSCSLLQLFGVDGGFCDA